MHRRHPSSPSEGDFIQLGCTSAPFAEGSPAPPIRTRRIKEEPEESYMTIELRTAAGNKIGEYVLEAGGDCPGIQVPKGMYHTCVGLLPGSVIFEAKDRPYDPEMTEDFL